MIVNLMTKSLVWMGKGDIQLLDREISHPDTGELLIQVKACAICGSDLRIKSHGNSRVSAGRTMGHEVSGVIIELGANVKGFSIGESVAIGADIPCGQCSYCLAGHANNCKQNLAMGYQFDGGFSRYLLVPAVVVNNGPIHKLNGKVDHSLACLAEPLACCINGYEVAFAEFLKPKNVLIFGAGPIGLMLGKMAPFYNIDQLTFVESNENRRQAAQKIFPKAKCFDFHQPDLLSQLADVQAEGFALIFTACSDIATHALALKQLAIRGVLNLFGGLPAGAAKLEIDSNFIHYREALVTGSHGSTPAQHGRALELIQSGKVDLRDLMTHAFPLSRAVEAFAAAASGDAIKVIITPDV